MTRTKLSLDALTVESFMTDDATPGLRGTVRGHEFDPTRNCNTRQPFCQVPSQYEVCPISDVECA